MKKKLKISVSGEDNELTSIFFTPCSDENLSGLLDAAEEDDLFNYVFNGKEYRFYGSYPNSGIVKYTIEGEETKEDDNGFNPSFAAMTVNGIMDNWGDDPETYEPHVKFMKEMKFDTLENRESEAIKKVWEQMGANKTDSDKFFHLLLKEILGDNPAAAVWCSKLEDGDEDSFMSAEFEIDVDGEFDISKIEFISFDEEFESEPLESYASHDMVLLNAIVYDGKMYFAKDEVEVEDGYDGDNLIEESGVINSSEF